MDKRRFVNLISLARIPLALALVVLFGEDSFRLGICVGICAVALLTDILDGFFARRLGVASTEGRHWDSLGDKSFYIAIVVSFLSNQLLLTVLAWGLLAREVALYITRILYIQNLGRVEEIRPFTNWHGYFMYGLIVLGFIEMFGRVNHQNYSLYLPIQLAALAALGCGVASIFAYVRLGR